VKEINVSILTTYSMDTSVSFSAGGPKTIGSNYSPQPKAKLKLRGLCNGLEYFS
jgi:hypothetical protein